VANNHGTSVDYDVVAYPVYPSNGSDEVANAVATIAQTHDIVPVVSAGNAGLLGNRSMGSPSVAEETISVGAGEYKRNDVTWFSSRGPVGYGEMERHGVDIVAPGQDVISAYPNHRTAGDTQYVAMSGTSMSAPHVSGVISLMLSADSSLNRTETQAILGSSTQPIPGGENAVGSGMLDAWAAVNQTAPEALNTSASTEAGVQELHAGLGYGDGSVDTTLDPLTDPEGDAGSGPDIRASQRDVVDEFELATNGTTKNATVRLYVDVDQNNSTGDPAESGAEYRFVINRTYDASTGAYSLVADEQAYNASAGGYEPTPDLYVSTGNGNAELVEIWTYFSDEAAAEEVSWHVTTASLGGTASDRLPDADQVHTKESTDEIPATAVVYNSTAGQPVSGETVQFRLYRSNGESIVQNPTTVKNVTKRGVEATSATTPSPTGITTSNPTAR
jgi:hypothetical protein